MKNLYSFLIISFCFSLVVCTSGVTVRTGVSNFTCFKQKGYVFGIIRGYLNIGKVDPNVRNNLIAASNAKLMYADVFINPCTTCNMKPEDQVKQLVEEIKGVDFGIMYVMVQIKDKWLPNHDENCKYVNAMIDEIARNGISPGIGSDQAEWNQIMGNSCRIQNTKTACWWDKHDKKASFDNFKPFGGFTFPILKEYDGPENICGIEVDKCFCNC